MFPFKTYTHIVSINYLSWILSPILSLQSTSSTPSENKAFHPPQPSSASWIFKARKSRQTATLPLALSIARTSPWEQKRKNNSRCARERHWSGFQQIIPFGKQRLASGSFWMIEGCRWARYGAHARLRKAQKQTREGERAFHGGKSCEQRDARAHARTERDSSQSTMCRKRRRFAWSLATRSASNGVRSRSGRWMYVQMLRWRHLVSCVEVYNRFIVEKLGCSLKIRSPKIL